MAGVPVEYAARANNGHVYNDSDVNVSARRNHAVGYTYLLFTNQPLATKLDNTTSACDLVILRLLVSRRAAIDEMQKASLGAVMI